jgi:hypothetical protein
LPTSLPWQARGVRADMVEAAEFPALAQRYEAHGVPLTVVNGRRAFEGALASEQALLLEILKAADRDAYGDRGAAA